MPYNLPEFLKPLVGYAMWHLGRNQSPGEVLELIKAHRVYGGFPEGQIKDALDQAWRNYQASSRLRLPVGKSPLADVIGPGISRDEVVGVRIGVPDNEGRPGAWRGSITVNVPAGMTQAEIMAIVRGVVARGGMESRGRDTAMGNMDDAFIWQVIEGGLDAPALDLTR